MQHPSKPAARAIQAPCSGLSIALHPSQEPPHARTHILYIMYRGGFLARRAYPLPPSFRIKQNHKGPFYTKRQSYQGTFLLKDRLIWGRFVLKERLIKDRFVLKDRVIRGIPGQNGRHLEGFWLEYSPPLPKLFDGQNTFLLKSFDGRNTFLLKSFDGQNNFPSKSFDGQNIFATFAYKSI